MIIERATLIYCIGCVLATHHCVISKLVTKQTKKHRNTEGFEKSRVVDHRIFEASNDEVIYHNLPSFQKDKDILDSNTHEENVGEGRLLASYFFPLFPQFYDVDYNDVWNWLKRSETIGYFLFENTLDVSAVNQSTIL